MSDIPLELLNIIARNLKEPTDLIRFRSVSSQWQCAMSSLPMPEPPLPWLFLCFRPDKRSCYLYSFSEDRIYTIHLPDGWDSVDFLNPSSDGWFPSSKEKNNNCKYTSLLNLFTGRTVDLLPPRLRPIWYINNSSRQNMMQIFPDCNRLWRIGNCSLPLCRLLAVAKSITYHNRCLYIISLRICTHMIILDATTLQVISMIPVPHKEEQCYLAVSSDKIYILVSFRCRPMQLKLFVMDQHSMIPKWREVRDIGNQAILHDRKRCFLVEAGSSTGLKRNSVYFPELKQCKSRADGPTNWVYLMNRFDLSNSNCEEVTCRLSSFLISDSWKQCSSAGTHSWIIPTFG